MTTWKEINIQDAYEFIFNKINEKHEEIRNIFYCEFPLLRSFKKKIHFSVKYVVCLTFN